MSEPSRENGPDLLVNACGGKYFVTAEIGVHRTFAELAYDKYCRPSKVPREHLYYVLAWLKHIGFPFDIEDDMPLIRVFESHAACIDPTTCHSNQQRNF